MQGANMKKVTLFPLFFVVCGISRVFATSSSSSSPSSSSSSSEDEEATVVHGRLQAESSIRSLDALVERLMECRKIPGLVLAVVGQKENDVLRREYGYANIRDSVPMTQHTRHCIASCTKAFTSILLGKMLQNTRYSWDTPVFQILRDQCQFSDEYLTEHVTIRDILSHRTGIESNYDAAWFTGNFNRTELLKRIRHMPIGNKFRSNANYNNIVYSLAGSIIEAIGKEDGGLRGREDGEEGGGGRSGSGGGGGEGRGRGGPGGGSGGKMSWEDELRARILDPLEMLNTSFHHRREEPEQFATPYYLARGRVEELQPEPGFNRGVEAIASSVAVCATSSDISLWMKCLLSALISDDCHVVPREVVRSVTEAQMLVGDMFHSYIQRPRAPVSLIVDAYGMGWFTGYYRDRRLAMHYGSLPGAYSLLTLVPDLHLGIFLTYNGAIQTDPYTINALILTHLLDTVLGLPSWITDLDRDACNFPTSSHFRNLVPASTQPNASDFAHTRHHAHTYVGVYAHPVLGRVTVKHGEGRLHLSYGLIDSDLLPHHEPNSSSTARDDDDDVERFMAIPRRPGWVQLIGHFQVRFSRLDTDDGDARTTFSHVTVPFLNDERDGVYSSFTRVRQGYHHDHHHHVDATTTAISSFTDHSSSARHPNCLRLWHLFAPIMLLLLLLLLLQTQVLVIP